jgi:hypothetical protein
MQRLPSLRLAAVFSVAFCALFFSAQRIDVEYQPRPLDGLLIDSEAPTHARPAGAQSVWLVVAKLRSSATLPRALMGYAPTWRVPLALVLTAMSSRPQLDAVKCGCITALATTIPPPLA